MPDQEYYQDAKFAAMRDKYVEYVADLLVLSGQKDATRAASAVMAFETRLAKAQWPPVDLRNIDKVYTRSDMAGRRS